MTAGEMGGMVRRGRAWRDALGIRLTRLFRSTPSRRSRARRAVVAVEFAILGPPFLLCLSFLLELGYDLYAQEMLDYGMQSAARQIQIGAAQGATSPANFAYTYFCGAPTAAVTGLLNCSNISVNVNPIPVTSNYYTAATGGSVSVPLTGGKLDTSKFAFCPGGPNTPMLATAVYTSPSIVALFVPSMATASGSIFVRTTLSAAAFVNESFTLTATPPAGC